MAENVAGKGVLWDNVIAGASKNTTNKSVGPGAGRLIGPGLDVVIVLAVLGLVGACLFLGRARKR
jgi:hypothetical protein